MDTLRPRRSRSSASERPSSGAGSEPAPSLRVEPAALPRGALAALAGLQLCAGALVSLFFALFGGFILSKEAIPQPLQWMLSLNPLHYAYEVRRRTFPLFPRNVPSLLTAARRARGDAHQRVRRGLQALGRGAVLRHQRLDLRAEPPVRALFERLRARPS